MARAIRGLRAFGAFWWDFVVGDDWRLAVGVVGALALTAVAAHQQVAAWWIVPVVIFSLLTGSVLAVARSARRR